MHVNVTRLTLSIGKIPEPGKGVLFFKKKLSPDSCILESEAKKFNKIQLLTLPLARYNDLEQAVSLTEPHRLFCNGDARTYREWGLER